MIDIGSIAYGPELRRKPIMRDLERLSRLLREASGDPVLEVAYVVPGSLGHADFDGFEIRARRDRGVPIVFVSVPPSIVEEADPLAALIDLARQAAAVAADKGRLSVEDRGAALLSLDRATVELGLGAVDRPDELGAEPSVCVAAQEPGIEVVLPVTDRTAIGAAFALEAALHDRLVTGRVGYVDGNDVGDGEFAIYVYGPDLGKLERAVAEVVRAQWRLPGAALRVIHGTVVSEE